MSTAMARSIISEFNFASMKAKEIAVSLMTRAIDRGDTQKMYERISHHFNRAHDMPEEHKHGLVWARLWDQIGESQGVRAMNMVADQMRQDLVKEGKDIPDSLLDIHTAVLCKKPTLN